jgi:hypothetical protein
VVVDVVESGVNWPAIITGVIGIAGIAGTFVLSRNARKSAAEDLKDSLKTATDNVLAGITAEDRRAERLLKVRIYHQCHEAFLSMIGVVLRHRVNSIERPDGWDYRKVQEPLAAPRRAMWYAVSELKLIAPPKIASLADDISAWYLWFIDRSRAGDPMPDLEVTGEVASMETVLYNLMREDLGIEGLVTRLPPDQASQAYAEAEADQVAGSG